jgi:hypothetical protein
MFHPVAYCHPGFTEVCRCVTAASVHILAIEAVKRLARMLNWVHSTAISPGSTHAPAIEFDEKHDGAGSGA